MGKMKKIILIIVIIKKTTKFKFAQRTDYTRKWLWVKNNRILLLIIKIIKLCLQKVNYRYVILILRLYETRIKAQQMHSFYQQVKTIRNDLLLIGFLISRGLVGGFYVKLFPSFTFLQVFVSFLVHR